MSKRFIRYSIEKDIFTYTDVKEPEINYTLYGTYIAEDNKEAIIPIFASENIESTKEMYTHITGSIYEN